VSERGTTAEAATLPNETAGRRDLVSLGLLGALAFVVTADARVVDPLLPVIADDFTTSIATAGLAVSAYTIPYGLFQLFYGPLGDRAGKLRVMGAAAAVFAIGTAACGLAPSLPFLVLLRFLTGMTAAAIIPLSLAYIGDNYPYSDRQAAIGRYLTAIALGQILGTSLGGTVADILSWRLIFLTYGLASLALAAIFWRATRPFATLDAKGAAARGPLISLTPYRRLLQKPMARRVLATVFIEGFCFYGGFVYVGASLRDRFDLAYAAIGAILAGFGIGGLIYSRTIRYLLRRLGEPGLVLLGGSLVSTCMLALAVIGSWQLAIPLVILTGIGFYALHGTLQTKATELSPGARGTAVSAFAFCLFVGQGLGAATFGRLVDQSGYAPAFVVSGFAVAILAAIFALRVLTPARNS
jgi:predicted MFS family arabinose efflux permease